MALSCSLSLDAEGQTDWRKPFFSVILWASMFLLFMGDEAGESKSLFLPFLCFSSFVMFISLSHKDCRKVLCHRAQELPHFLPSPNASLLLESTRKVFPFFLVCFVENTVLHQYRFWNGSWCGWFLICLSVLCPRSWPLHALWEHCSQLHEVSGRLLLFPSQGLRSLSRLLRRLLL